MQRHNTSTLAYFEVTLFGCFAVAPSQPVLELTETVRAQKSLCPPISKTMGIAILHSGVIVR